MDRREQLLLRGPGSTHDDPTRSHALGGHRLQAALGSTPRRPALRTACTCSTFRAGDSGSSGARATSVSRARVSCHRSIDARVRMDPG
jgi:hypothetical protein